MSVDQFCASSVGVEFFKRERSVVGQECIDNRQNYEISYPIKNGIVTSWPDMILVWEHAIYEKLGLTKERVGESDDFCYRSATKSDKKSRKMVEIMFEHFGFKGVFVHVQAVLTLYAQGLLTGLVLDSGDRVARGPCDRWFFTKRQADETLGYRRPDGDGEVNRTFRRRGTRLEGLSDVDSIRDEREGCFVAEERKRWLRLARRQLACAELYEFDGRRIKVESERFMAPEIMFEPSLVGVESVGVSELVFECVQECDMDSRMADVRKRYRLEWRVDHISWIRRTVEEGFG